MKAVWTVRLSTGYDLSDNDLYRFRERLLEAVRPLAEEYCADLEVGQGYNIPGPPLYAGQEAP